MKLQIDQKIPKSMSLVSVPNVTKQSNISYSFGVFGVIKTLIQPLILVCNWAERNSAGQHAHAFQARVKFGPVLHQPALIMVWRVLSVCKTSAGHVVRTLDQFVLRILFHVFWDQYSSYGALSDQQLASTSKLHRPCVCNRLAWQSIECNFLGLHRKQFLVRITTSLPVCGQPLQRPLRQMRLCVWRDEQYVTRASLNDWELALDGSLVMIGQITLFDHARTQPWSCVASGERASLRRCNL